MGLGVSLVDSGNGNGKPPLKWVTLFFLAILQNGVTETQGNPPRAQTSALSFKG
jgi:hypothetical protein